MNGVAFVDTETTGLSAERHEIWEVGLIVDGKERSWLLPVDLCAADEIALGIGRFHERHPQGNDAEVMPGRPLADLSEFAREFARATHGRHLVGAVISFDAERLSRLLLDRGVSPSWHYHLIDVEALAVGYLHGYLERDDERLAACAALPWKSEHLSREVGVDPDLFDKHTALGDARWAKAIYEAVMG